MYYLDKIAYWEGREPQSYVAPCLGKVFTLYIEFIFSVRSFVHFFIVFYNNKFC